MAFNSVGFEAEITFIDAGNNLSKVNVGVGGADIAAAETIMASNIADFVAVTDAYVLSYTVREKFANDAARTPAGEVEEKAVITVNLETTPKKAIITIPAPKASIFAGAPGSDLYNQVDGADSAVLALIGDFVAGGLSLSDGENVPATGAFVKGRRTHRRSSRG